MTPRTTSLVAFALSVGANSAIAGEPTKVRIEGRNAYAEFYNETETCAAGANSTYALVAFNEQKVKHDSTLTRAVSVQLSWTNPCKVGNEPMYAVGYTDLVFPWPDPVVIDRSSVDKKLRRARIDASFPIAVDGSLDCQVTVELDLRATPDAPVTKLGVTQTWRDGSKYHSQGVMQPAAAVGSVVIGNALNADGSISDQACPLPDGAPTEYAVGNLGWSGETPATFLSETKTTTWERNF